MLQLRTYDQIFPSSYYNRPDEDEICRRVCAHLSNAQLPRDVYEWVERMDDPYLRETYATGCMLEIVERTANGEGFNNSYIREEVENHLSRIIRYARNDQMAEEMLVAEKNPTIQPRYEASLGERVATLERLIEQLVQDKNHVAASGVLTYIVPSTFKSMEDVEAELREASKEGAASLARYMHRAEKIGLMNFGGDSKQDILNIVNAHLGTDYKYNYWRRIF